MTAALIGVMPGHLINLNASVLISTVYNHHFVGCVSTLEWRGGGGGGLSNPLLY